MTIGGVEVKWDDNSGPGLGSQINYLADCSFGSQEVTIWIRAASNASGGNPALGFTYTFKHTNFHPNPDVVVLNDTLVPLGGWLLGGAGGVINTIPSETVETVLTNNGAAATFLMLFRKDDTAPAHYRLIAWDQTSGVGLGSKLGGTNYGNELWVLATPAEGTRPGPVRVVRNDVSLGDTDSDGLGNSLEQEVCTCKAIGQQYCPLTGQYQTCNASGINTTKDTDSDGLRDKWELLGIEPSQDPPQYLPRWGSNPRRRDIFVEIDRMVNLPNESDGPLTSEQTVIDAAGPFAALPINNPDGSTGISTHFDIGGGTTGLGCENEDGDWLTTNDGDVDGITKFCGDFGGATESSIMYTRNCAQDIFSMSPARHGVFRWMVRRSVGSGNTPGVPQLCSYLGPSTDGIGLVAHELGHQLGIAHNGSNNNMNMNPAYKSLMNYAYSTFMFVDVDPGPIVTLQNRRAFSNGSLTAWPLDPRSLSERTSFGSGTTPLDFMTNSSAGYDFDTEPNNQRWIDWNRDGDWSSSVRAHVVGIPNRRDFGGASMPQAVGQENLWNVLSDTSPAAAYDPISAKTIVIVNRQGDNLLAKATKTGGFSWTGWSVMEDSPFLRADSSPAAALYTVGSYTRLWVVAVTESDNIQFARYNPATVTIDEEWEEWQSIALPGNVSLREVSVTVSGSRMYVAGVDLNALGGDLGVVWMGWFDSGVWQGWTSTGIKSAGPGDVRLVTPGIAVGPDGKLYMYVRTNVQSPVAGADWLRMHVYTPSTAQWALAAQAPQGGSAAGCEGAIGRISMLYRPHRTAAGSPLSNGNGALWTWYSSDCDRDPLPPMQAKRETLYRWTWATFNATSQSFNLGKWHRTDSGHNECDYVFQNGNGAGVAIVDHPESIGAFFAHNPDSTCPGGVWSIPYADGEGHPPEPVDDYDDVSTILQNLCTSLHLFDGGQCWCGEDVSCGAPQIGEDQLCYDDPRYQ